MNTPNPYAPPPPPSPRVSAAAAGSGEFSIPGVLGEAWALSVGCKATFLAVFAVLFVALWLLQALLGLVFGIRMSDGSALPLTLLWQLVLAAVIYPGLAGVTVLSLKRADGLAVTASDALNHGVPLGQAALLGVLLTAATAIGFMLLVLPGLYLSVALMLALPLLVDRQLGAVDALKASQRAVQPSWFRCAALLVVLGVMLAIGAATIIGLIWVLPISAIALALVYRSFFPATASVGRLHAN